MADTRRERTLLAWWKESLAGNRAGKVPAAGSTSASRSVTRESVSGRRGAPNPVPPPVRATTPADNHATKESVLTPSVRHRYNVFYSFRKIISWFVEGRSAGFCYVHFKLHLGHQLFDKKRCTN